MKQEPNRETYTVRGKTGTILELARHFDIPYQTVYVRLRSNGYDLEKALTDPRKQKRKTSYDGRPAVDHTGERHGRLTVREYAGRNEKGVLWLCDCDCGRTRVVNSSALRYASSCGQCIKRLPKRERCIPQKKVQPCWHCKNYIDGCSWARKEHLPVAGWKAKKVHKLQGRNKPFETYEITYCPEFISDGTEGAE